MLDSKKQIKNNILSEKLLMILIERCVCVCVFLQLTECVRRGVSLLVRDSDGCSALHLAAQNGHTALVSYILQQGETEDAQIQPVLGSYFIFSVAAILVRLTLKVKS